jgi:hypothetical protein
MDVAERLRDLDNTCSATTISTRRCCATADDLRELGVAPIEHRSRLLDAIARLVDG